MGRGRVANARWEWVPDCGGCNTKTTGGKGSANTRSRQPVGVCRAQRARGSMVIKKGMEVSMQAEWSRECCGSAWQIWILCVIIRRSIFKNTRQVCVSWESVTGNNSSKIRPTWLQNESVRCSGARPSMLVDYVAVRCLDDDVHFLVGARQHLHCIVAICIVHFRVFLNLLDVSACDPLS